jgi:cytochrome oxidase Cu insertion factor (SCO1/SenC/PrrC family)
MSVDPKRDTRELLKASLGSSDLVPAGLSDMQKMATAAKPFCISHRKVPAQGGSHTIDHTASRNRARDRD